MTPHRPRRPLFALALVIAPLAPFLPAQPARAQGAGEIDIVAERFGVADTVRPGSWFGVRLAITDNGDRVRDAVVRLHVPDADGDTALMQRVVTLNPGARVGVWLYARMPFGRRSADALYTVTVHAVPPGESADALAAGRQIGAARIQPSAPGVLGEPDGAFAVLGRPTMGLDQYSVEVRPGYSGTLHELTRLVAGLTPADISDAWMGLAVFDALIWVDGLPSELREGQVEALAEWIHRGGRLLIVVPAVGEVWSNPRANPLFDLLPAARFERQEDVSLETLRPLLTLNERLPLPARQVAHTFDVPAGATDAYSILADRAGRPLIVRRPIGAGDVTLIGLDLASPDLSGRIDAQALWSRILGRRGDLFSQAEMEELSRGDQRADFRARSSAWIDRDIGDIINQTGRASVGVLLGLLLFASYLAIAGPVSFAVLGRLKKREHSWLVFVATAALFTAIAWGGASATRPARVNLTHLSILSHVYGQPVQRSRSWFGVLLPDYGDQTVAIAREETAPWRNALSSWDRERLAGPSSFPDSREYVIDARRPDSMRVPTRSTVKEFQADWLGAPRWSLPRPAPVGAVRADDLGRLRGSLTHDLPGPLHDVVIIHNRRQRPLTRPGPGGPPFFDAQAVRLTAPWAPGQALSLSEQFSVPGSAQDFFNDLVRKEQAFGLGGTSTNEAPLHERLEMLLWGGALEQPDWQPGGRGTRTMLQRRAERWDVGAWFTQPCLIVVGHLLESPSPVPILVDDREPPATGRTVVCWVYPLPPDPPTYPPQP